MANKTLFQRAADRLSRNEAGGKAYTLSAKQALAQYAATGCLSQSYYASAESQLDDVLACCAEVDAVFLAQLAVYSRERSHMKDMPALLCAVLTLRGPEFLPRIFERVIDNGRMLRNFVQILRSGQVGRRSLGTMPRRLVREWLDARSDDSLVRASIGQSPSLADVIKMVHPKPRTPSRSALYAWLCGRAFAHEELPQTARALEQFKAGARDELPDVPFQMLSALGLDKAHWRTIAARAPWQTTRMNLNTFQRHGVFDDDDMIQLVAAKLRDPVAISRARVFPYQLMMAYLNTRQTLPHEIAAALQDAMEIATANVPRFEGKTYVCVDVSSSMTWSVTGGRGSSSSKARCIDVAALAAATILRQNPGAKLLPFAMDVTNVNLNPRDTVLTNAYKLSKLAGGGTDCSAPLRALNDRRAIGDRIVLVSDNESWIDRRSAARGTGTIREFTKFKKRNPGATLICIDIQPYRTVQAPPREDILHVGGFSDSVFDVIRSFTESKGDADHWVRAVERCSLE